MSPSAISGRETFVIEAAGLPAGLVVRERAGYRFFTAVRALRRLDGELFRSPERAARRAASILRARAAQQFDLPPAPFTGGTDERLVA